MKTLFAGIMALLLAACSTVPQTPVQTVYAATATYAAALSVAVKYKQLPPCADAVTHSPICSRAETVAELREADGKAFAALSAAQVAVRTPDIGTTAIERTVSAANRAIAVFSAVTASLGAKE